MGWSWCSDGPERAEGAALGAAPRRSTAPAGMADPARVSSPPFARTSSPFSAWSRTSPRPKQAPPPRGVEVRDGPGPTARGSKAGSWASTRSQPSDKPSSLLKRTEPDSTAVVEYSVFNQDDQPLVYEPHRSKPTTPPVLAANRGTTPFLWDVEGVEGSSAEFTLGVRGKSPSGVTPVASGVAPVASASKSTPGRRRRLDPTALAVSPPKQAAVRAPSAPAPPGRPAPPCVHAPRPDVCATTGSRAPRPRRFTPRRFTPRRFTPRRFTPRAERRGAARQVGHGAATPPPSGGGATVRGERMQVADHYTPHEVPPRPPARRARRPRLVGARAGRRR